MSPSSLNTGPKQQTEPLTKERFMAIHNIAQPETDPVGRLERMLNDCRARQRVAIGDLADAVNVARTLAARVAELDRAEDRLIGERDQLHDLADKLAYAVAPIEVIGEHSSMNDPWENALDLITPFAEVERLTANVAELEARPSRAAGFNEAADRLSELRDRHRKAGLRPEAHGLTDGINLLRALASDAEAGESR